MCKKQARAIDLFRVCELFSTVSTTATTGENY